MAKKINAFKSRKGQIFEKEIDADIADLEVDIAETVNKLDFLSTKNFSTFDVGTYTLNEFVRLGRMSTDLIKLKDEKSK